MKKKFIFSLVLLTLPLWGQSGPFSYPSTRKGDVEENYHGQKIADPYRWLEDTDSQETRKWIEAQNKLTFGYLEKVPGRKAIQERLTELWDYERYAVPFREGSFYFIFRNDGLQNQSVLYVMDSLKGTPRVLLDPNKFSTDGTVALSSVVPSDDGKFMAYGVSRSGSDWQEWKIRDVATGADLSDELKWIKFSSASWRRDGSGFFYSRFDEPQKGSAFLNVNYYHKIYFHKKGTSQAEDVLVYHRPDQKEWNFNGGVTEDDRYLIISVSQGTDPKNRVFYKDLKTEGSPVVELLNAFDAAYEFVGNEGSLFWFMTDLQAPRSRLVAIDIRHPEKSHWQEIIPQSTETLQSVSLLNKQFVCTYLKDAHSEVRIYDKSGNLLRDVPLPGLGTVSGFPGRSDDTETFYSFTGFTEPGTIFRYDLKTGSTELFRRPAVKFDPSAFETKQVFVRSKDGTKVPLFITHRKGLKKNGKNPTYLYGYGGFGISLTPSFSIPMITWMEMGGVYAVANLRGGGEYGEEWHQAGTKLNKQNVFDDFISAAEWLIKEDYTRPEKLAIAGGSNGGLLVGACLTQRPDLFGATLPAVGVLDMLRFHKFTIGWAWTSDYGSADNEGEFKALIKYSPLHNVKKRKRYPATMITTADHDDRVVPGHSFKFAATLQEAQEGKNPVLIRIDTKAGHGAGKPTTKLIEEATDRLSFLLKELRMKVPGYFGEAQP